MVLIFSELERRWQWEWILRPHQKVGMTVEDYYTRFCDWRHEMVASSFPVEEGDYIDGFIANLRSDVFCKLSTDESCYSRLIDAYYDARFAESMMIIEENIRQIKAQKVFDEIPKPESEHNDEIQDTEDVGNVESDGFMVQIEAEYGDIVSPNADAKVLDEMPSRTHGADCNDGKSQLVLESIQQPHASGEEDFNTAISEKLVNAIDEMISQPATEIQGDDLIDSFQEKSVERIPDGEMHDVHVHGIAEVPMQLEDDPQNFAMSNGLECKMFDSSTDKSTEPKFAGLNLCSGYFYSYPMIEEVELSLHKGEMMLNENVDQSYSFTHEVTLPGNEEKYDLSSIKVDNQFVDYMLDHNIWLNDSLMLIFDPGGCFRLHRGCGSFECCNEQGDNYGVVNVAEPLIISDPNVQEVKTFIHTATMTGAVNSLPNGSTISCFEKVTSIPQASLGKIVMEDNHDAFDKRSKLRTHVDHVSFSWMESISVTEYLGSSFVCIKYSGYYTSERMTDAISKLLLSCIIPIGCSSPCPSNIILEWENVIKKKHIDGIMFSADENKLHGILTHSGDENQLIPFDSSYVHSFNSRYIRRIHELYALEVQAFETIFGPQNLVINGGRLVLLAANSSITRQHADVVTLVTLYVTCAQVPRQLVFPMKAYSIMALLIGETLARHMVDRIDIIRDNKGQSLWNRAMIMRTKFAVDLYLVKAYSTSSSMDYLAKLIAIIPMPSSTRTITVFPHFGQCKNVISLTNNGVVFSFDLGATACFFITQNRMDRFHLLWGEHFDSYNWKNAAFVKNVLLGEDHLRHELIILILGQTHLMSQGSLVYLCFWVCFDVAMTILLPIIYKICVWDPGRNIISLYTLEDMDIFEKAGKRIIPLNVTWVILEVIRDVQKHCIIMEWCEMAGYLNTCDVLQMEIEHSSDGLVENLVWTCFWLHCTISMELMELYSATKEFEFQASNRIALAELASQLQMVSINVTKFNGASTDTFIWDPGHDAFYLFKVEDVNEDLYNVMELCELLRRFKSTGRKRESFIYRYFLP